MFFLKGRQGATRILYYPTLFLLKPVSKAPRQLAGGFHFPWITLPLTFIIIALARPAGYKEHVEHKTSGVDIVLAIDVSRSMEIHDFIHEGYRIDRLSAAQITAKNFIEKRPNDRIGLVAFAGRPYLVSPLTMAHNWLPILIEEEVVTSHQVAQGTAIGSAIGFSSLHLDNVAKDSKTKIVILITDGSSNSGKLLPEAAAEKAKTLGIKVYTLAIGTKEGRLPGDSFNAPVQFDTETLKKIAQTTGAKYYRATHIESLAESFDDIDKLEKVEVTVDRYREILPYHYWFTSAACILLAIQLLLGTIRARHHT